MVFSTAGCYYGVLNVLDPTIQYDANGKVVGPPRLAAASPPTNNDDSCQRDGPDGSRDQGNDLNDRDDVVVETVESDSQAFHPHVTYVSETDMRSEPSAEPECLIEPVEVLESVSESVSVPLEDTAEDTAEEPAVPIAADGGSDDAVQIIEEVEADPKTLATEQTSPTAEKEVTALEAAPEEASVQDREVNATAEATPEADASAEPKIEENSGSAAVPLVPAVDEARVESTPTSDRALETTEEAATKQPEEIVVDRTEEEDIEELSEGRVQAPVVDLVKAPVSAVAAPGQQAEAATERQPICVEEEPQSMVLVADYMEATQLFKAIQRKNWQAVLYFLRTGSFSFSSLSKDAMTHVVQEQAQTWVSKKDASGNELWRQLPLHAAVCFGASPKVIEKLILAYPEALKSPDCHGNLPLHLAYIFDAENSLIALLMTTFPAAVHVMNFKGLQPIQCSNEISSETFQYNAELFGALSDYTRAVAENDPDKLTEQLQEVRKQLKSVNDTLFADAVPRQLEPIREYMRVAPPPPSPPASVQEESPANTLVEYGPGAFLREVGFGICLGGARQQVAEEMAPQEFQELPRNAADEVIVLDDAPMEDPMPAPSSQTCRVMEYCSESKTWKEV